MVTNDKDKLFLINNLEFILTKIIWPIFNDHNLCSEK